MLFLVGNAKQNGGTEVLARNLCTALNARGVESRLLSADELVPSCNGIWTVIDKLLGGRLTDKRLAKAVAVEAKAWGADWVVGHTYDYVAAIPAGGSWKIAQVFNWSICGYEKGYRSYINNKRGISRLLSLWSFAVKRYLWHSAITKLDRLVVLSNAARKEVTAVCPKVDEQKVVVIPDPIMAAEPSKMISSLKNKRVIFVGRLSQEKGVLRLLRIWERIHRALPGWTLAIYGDGHKRGEMDEYISRRQIDGVAFMGFCRNLEQIYTSADLLLMTSDTEGFGMVLIEAMYYGVPCVSFDCPVSPKEIIGDAGVTVKCFDEDEYAKKVVELLKDSARMQRLQNSAIKRAMDFYIDKVVALWKDVINVV